MQRHHHNTHHNDHNCLDWLHFVRELFKLQNSGTNISFFFRCCQYLDHIASDDKRFMNWKEFGSKLSRPNGGSAPAFDRRGWEKPRTPQDSRCPGRDPNRSPPEYKPWTLPLDQPVWFFNPISRMLLLWSYCKMILLIFFFLFIIVNTLKILNS